MQSAPRLTDLVQQSIDHDKVKSVVDEYAGFHAENLEARKSHYTQMVNDYYDLVTDFYEFGWGESFHFAPRHRDESFAASLARHEHYLAARIGLRPGMRALDVGCGVGGPMREISRFSGADVVGVNNNDYQIARGNKKNERAGLSHRCSFLKADFMKLPLPANSFDAVYAIEATCHAPDKTALFKELFRVMKPGAHFAGYEWCLTDRYVASNQEHRAIKKGIEVGDGLPDLWHTQDVDQSLRDAGFDLIETRDTAGESDEETPWYLPLSAGWTMSGWKHTSVGRLATNYGVRLLETLRVAPKGSHAVSTLLNNAATALVQGGETGIFTPMYFFHVKKP